MQREIAVTVNGKSCRHSIPTQTLLIYYLRDLLGLTSAHIGCETSQCGTCTVLLDGQAVKSCTLLAMQADGGEIRTAEGLALEGELSLLQRAFWEEHGLQCGYCTPGMLLAATALLERCPHPDDDQIKTALHGNLCRCTGYQNIVRAVKAAADAGA